MWKILQIIFWTWIPVFELRFSIPYGIYKLEMNWFMVFIVAIIANIFLGIVIYIILEWLIKIFTKIPFINLLWQKYIDKTQIKIQSGVEKYGEWAIAIFIAVPLPGSGVYTGAVAAFLIGLDQKKFFIANIIGVLIAGILVTILSLTLGNMAGIFLKSAG